MLFMSVYRLEKKLKKGTLSFGNIYQQKFQISTTIVIASNVSNLSKFYE